MVKLLALDTSVAVPLISEAHPLHDETFKWAKGKHLHFCGHALFETYSVITRLPGDARGSANDVARVLEANFERPLMLSENSAKQAVAHFAEKGIFGGSVWDGLVGLAAIEHNATLVTRDARALAIYDALGVETLLL
jgi:predicted nucleic acid-binding protein